MENATDGKEGTGLTVGNTNIVTLLGLIVFSPICGLLSIVGVITNSVCIRIFSKQGKTDPANIPLLAMSMSFLLCDVAMLWCALCNVMVVVAQTGAPLLVEPVGFNAMTGYLPRIIFYRITSWLMAFIALQRCVCVTLPLKVKLIFNTWRTTVITLVLCKVSFLIHLTSYISRQLVLAFNPRVNLTQLVMVVIPEALEMSYVVNQAVFITLPMVNFFFILICTLVLIIKLQMTSRWRRGVQSTTLKTSLIQHITSAPDNEKSTRTTDARSVKETRMTKMIATTTTIFVFSTLPSNVAIVYMTVVETENSVADALHILAFLMETMNSTVMLYVYYTMSSQFRDKTREMFCRHRKV